MRKIVLTVAGMLVMWSSIAFAQQNSSNPKVDQHANCSMHDNHSKVNDRGEKGMGFSQTATTHHFFLKADGGLIQVEANDPTDAASRDEIRMHLAHIASAFQRGDFDIPMFVHDTVPPGVPEMKKLQKSIHYSFEETANGGRVVITSSDREALGAIHQFLRFQIDEHLTEDSKEVR